MALTSILIFIKLILRIDLQIFVTLYTQHDKYFTLNEVNIQNFLLRKETNPTTTLSHRVSFYRSIQGGVIFQMTYHLPTLLDQFSTPKQSCGA